MQMGCLFLLLGLRLRPQKTSETGKRPPSVQRMPVRTPLLSQLEQGARPCARSPPPSPGVCTFAAEADACHNRVLYL